MNVSTEMYSRRDYNIVLWIKIGQVKQLQILILEENAALIFTDSKSDVAMWP